MEEIRKKENVPEEENFSQGKSFLKEENYVRRDTTKKKDACFNKDTYSEKDTSSKEEISFLEEVSFSKETPTYEEKKTRQNVNYVDLETVCGITSALPENELPEFAFAGKSNVGKSSLINALMFRKSYARTSSQPGKTQTINFYNIEHELYFVDLPGYGYAKVSQKIKAKWGKMIERYLKKSKQLRKIFLLVDIRHEPSANDKEMYDWIVYQGFEPVIIATKLDKISRSQMQRQVKLIRTALNAQAGIRIIPFSAQTKQGREEIWECIEAAD